MYGDVVTTVRHGTDPISDIHNASLADEGEYSCEVIIVQRDASLSMPFTLHVFSKCVYACVHVWGGEGLDASQTLQLHV